MNIQPVIPARVSENWNLITRIIIPIIYQPTVSQPVSQGAYGFGDVSPSFFLSPAKPGKIIWGVGAAVALPTATNPFLGQGKWSIPGGLVHLGERIEDALVREIEEESGLRVRVLGFCGVIDRVVREQDAVRYHYVIIDYVAESVGGRLQAGSDAAEVRWIALDDLGQYDTTDGLADMIQRARAIQRAASAKSNQSGGPIR